MNKETKEDDGMVEVKVPFMGFYGTYAEDALCLFGDNDRYGASPALIDKMNEFDAVSDISECKELVSKTYVENFFLNLNAELKKEGLPPIIPFEYSGVVSPREYNFETDRVFVKVPRKIMVDYWKHILGDTMLRLELAKYLEEEFKSRDGFMSFYDHLVVDWEAKDPNKFDTNEMGAILMVLMRAFFTEEWEDFAVTEGCDWCKERVSWGEKADKIRDEIYEMQVEENR